MSDLAGEAAVDDDLVEGRYRRLRVLGRGAMGEVWLAEDVMLHRQVAVKTIAPGVRAPEQVDLDRMLREARLAARLNHPHVVAVYDLSVVDGYPQVVMEYVPGRTLADEIRERGRLTRERTAAVGLAVADALADAHDLGIVHRDVKPANILITPRGVPKIADFGIARVTDDTSLTETGVFVGTPAYVAPEMVQGLPADARSDLWALGVTLWTALEGRTPFERAPREGPLVVLGRVLNEPAPVPSQGEYLTPVVMRLLERNPARRPTAAQVVRLLRDLAEHPGPPPDDTRDTVRLHRPPPGPVFAPAVAAPTVRSTTTAGVKARGGQRGRAAALLAGLVVLAAAVFGVVVLASRGHGGPSDAGGSPSTSSSGSTSGPKSATPSVDLTSYTSNRGGITVRAPAGWHRDLGAGVVNISDYVAPGGADRLSGTYFRIGIGNPDSSKIHGNEGDDALHNLRNVYTGVKGVQVVAVRFQGVQAYDVEATGINQAGVARHLRERVWISDGLERIVQLNATAPEWSRYSPVFTQLVTSCTVR